MVGSRACPALPPTTEERIDAALGGEDVDAFLRAMGRSAGPPWQAKHKLAAAAALAAGRRAPISALES